MAAKFNERSSQSSKMNFIGAFNARSTGFATVNLDKEVDFAIESNQQQTQENIKRLQEVYGKQHLDEMEPAEFYKLYKHHTSGTQIWDLSI